MSSSDVDLLVTDLATEATSLWSLGQHDAALQTLQRLEGLLPTDPKVQINECVAGYYADSNTSLEALSEQLAAWLDNHATGTAANRTAYTTAAINYGILLYVQQQHSKALEVLEPLYNEVESMHGGAALCLCVLLLEIYLGSSQLPKVVQVLHYLQATTAPDVPARAAFCDDVTDDASSSHAREAEQVLGQQQAPVGLRHEQLLHSPKQTPKKLQQHTTSPIRLHQQQQQQVSPKQLPTVSMEQRQDRQQQQQQQQGESEQPAGRPSLDFPMVTRCTSAFMKQVAQVVEQQGGQIASMDIPALLHLYKARLAIACSNHKAAKKEVKALLALQPSSLTAMLCKAQLEVMRQQPKKSLKTLAPVLSAVADCSIRCKLQLLNVLAAIHQQLGKHHVAALYLSSALAQHQQALDKQQGPQRLQDSSQQQQQQQVGKQQQRNAGKQQGERQQKGGRNAAKATARAEADAPENSAAAAGAAAAAMPAGTAAEAPQSPRDSWQLLLDNSDALQYNMGLQQLGLHNWQAALECFEAASCKYYTQPQLWLRMAEASISLYHEQQEAQQAPQQQQQHQQQQQLPVLIHIGQHDSSSSSSISRGKSRADAAVSRTGIPGSALLQQAADQLSTGLALLRQQQAEAAKQAEEAAAAVTAAAVAAAAVAGEQQLTSPVARVTSTTGWLNSVAPHLSLFSQGDGAADAAASTSAIAADIAGSSSTAAAATADVAAAAAAAGIAPLGACILPQTSPALQQALLANQAYIHLLLQQPQQALEAAKALLACSSMSPQQHYLGSCYAAEALCMLGRTDAAAEQLQTHMALYISNSQVSSSGGGSGAATPSSLVAAARAAASEFGSSSQPAAQHTGDWHVAGSGGIGVGSGVFQASSIVSDDDSSCVGCKGVCGVGIHQPGHSTQRESQVAVLCNMSSVLAAQGDVQESRRYAAMAVAQDPNCAAANVVLGWSGLLEAGHQPQQ